MIKENFVFVRSSNGIERKYNYRLIKSEFKESDVYGIEIERVDCIGEEIIDSYKECVELISPNEKKVKELLEKLYNNQVSPLHLIDIAGEMIDESVADFAVLGL
ncbi:MAG: DUF6514 family protein [Clostridium sp.]|uniref:DUF6514 family protein n=1 Tax=Clostridium sp. TaxID=1506 RepID=UPI003F386721